MGAQKVLVASHEMNTLLQLEEVFALFSKIDVVMARTLDQVQSKAATEMPDLIFVDSNLPADTGVPLLRQIQKMLPPLKVPIIPMVTEEDVRNLNAHSLRGQEEYVCKPIDTQEFLRVMLRNLGRERRCVPRVKARLRIKYGVEGRNVLSNYTVNLSTGGVFIESSSVLPEGTPLSLEFILPESEEAIRCKGRVAWVNHPKRVLSPHLAPGMGIQFLGLGLQELHQLREYLKTALPDPSW